MTTSDAHRIAQEYFQAWNARDAAWFRSLLADTVTWEGPTWRADGAGACLEAFDQASGLVTEAAVQRMWVDGDDVVVWIEVRRPDGSSMPVATWMQVRDGRVRRIRATVDLLPSH